MGYAKLMAVSLIVLMSSCTESTLPVGEESPSVEATQEVIGWSVFPDGGSDAFGLKTRALVEDYATLRDACTQFEYQEAEKIGLLGNYTLDGVSSVAFDNVDLWWWEKENDNPYYDQLGNDSHWNYSGENVHWKEGAQYLFKAYFPKSKVVLQPGSSADKIITVYDTEVSQYDLLVAHRELPSKSENPVKLNMLHALAALKFDFKFVEEGVTDNLLACWLENGIDDGFYTSSTLNFEDDIVWPKSTPNPVAVPFYYWEPVSPLAITGESAAEAYTKQAPFGKGDTFTTNSGWLLIIPQSSQTAGTLNLCFRTSTGGSVVYKVALPAYEFSAGYRYNYHINISSTGIRLGLTIADWNERKSSYEIDFNE